jgi:hypothetical protein
MEGRTWWRYRRREAVRHGVPGQKVLLVNPQSTLPSVALPGRVLTTGLGFVAASVEGPRERDGGGAAPVEDALLRYSDLE